MKREGQFWIAIFTVLIVVPVIGTVCGVLSGRIDQERARVGLPDTSEAPEIVE